MNGTSTADARVGASPRPMTVIDDFNNRLAGFAQRTWRLVEDFRRLGDSIHGPSGEKTVGGAAGPVPVSTNMVSHLNELDNALQMLEQQAMRFSNG